MAIDGSWVWSTRGHPVQPGENVLYTVGHQLFEIRAAAMVERIEFIETALNALAPLIVLDKSRQAFKDTVQV